MTKLWASFYKEFLLVVRDKAGLAMLFIMPLFLIITMAIIMDAPFRDYQESGIELLMVNEDNDSLGNIIERGLADSEIFTIVKERNGKGISSEDVSELIKDGDYILGVIIPSGATNHVNNRVDNLVSSTLSQFGMPVDAVKKSNNEDPIIQIVLDPAVKRSFANTVVSSIKSYTSQVESSMILDGFYNQMTEDGGKGKKMEAGFIKFQEVYPSGRINDTEQQFTSSVQHNVPAWTVFAMFLIVVPLASNMIKEREGGSMLRLLVAPGSYLTILFGKLLFYVSICMIQFLLMMGVGVYLMPLFGLPSLIIQGGFVAIISVSLAISFSATAFGVLLGTLFNSYQQASIFGTVIDVIMAAVGGIMVPLFAMPDFMKFIGRMTPLNWGMESFNDLFLRNAGFIDVLPEVAKLFLFAAIILLSAWVVHKRNRLT